MPRPALVTTFIALALLAASLALPTVPPSRLGEAATITPLALPTPADLAEGTADLSP